MKSFTCRKALLLSSALAGVVYFGDVGVVAAQSTTVYQLDIPSENLAQALKDFSIASSQQIVFSEDDIGNRKAPALHGSYTTNDALKILLSGTDLHVEIGKSGVLVIKPKKEQAASNEGAANSSIATEPPETVVVTGTNIQGISILPSETRTIDRTEIANGGFSSIDQVLASIPQNFADFTPTTGTVSGAARTASFNAFDRGTGVDLRGLGSDSTLVLVNGQRRPASAFGYVTDLSGIPVSAIDRIDVVEGGESSIYGADAVAGVVNVITRRSFSGMETSLYGGLAPEGGGDRVQFDQTVGIDKADGGFVLAYDYTRDGRVDLVQRGLTTSISSLFLNHDFVQPDMTNQSILLSGHYELTDRLSAYFDGAYHFYQGSGGLALTLVPSKEVESNPVTDQHGEYDYSGGLNYRLDDWSFDLSGNFGLYRDFISESVNITSSKGAVLLSNPIAFRTRTSLASGRFAANGSLPEVLGIVPKLAVGAEFRHESIFSTESTTTVPYESGQRDVQSGFAEFYFPIIENGPTWAHRFDLSLSGRYDHYSDFGGTTNYLAGAVWEPADGLTMRGSYSTAFRPPALSDLNHPFSAFLVNLPDPQSSTGSSPVLELTNGSPATLNPETADTWNFGTDYKPDFVSGLTASVSYFGVEYRNRIGTPTLTSAQLQTVLQNPQVYGSLINRAPTAAYLASLIAQAATTSNTTGVPFNFKTQNILSVFPNAVVFDNDTTNAASENVNGLDFAIKLDRDADIGQWHFQFNAQKFLNFDRELLINQPSTSQIDSIGLPASFKFRTGLGWSDDLLTAYAFVNYVGSYQDIRVTPPGSISAWTTIDLNVRINLGALDSPLRMDGTSLDFAITNLFNAAPPRTSPDTTGIIYDGTNASPIGRYLGLRLTKGW